MLVLSTGSYRSLKVFSVLTVWNDVAERVPRFIVRVVLAAPVTFLYNTLFLYEKKLREKSPFRQSLIIGMIGKRRDHAVRHASFFLSLQANIYQMRKMEWCFSANFTAFVENYLRPDGEKRQLAAPVFNSRYAIDLLHKLVDDILFVLRGGGGGMFVFVDI